MVFKPTFTDYELSPFTGMTRESWIEAGKYLLEGVFRHIETFESPVVVFRKETKLHIRIWMHRRTYRRRNSRDV